MHSAARVGAIETMRKMLEKQPTLLNVRDHKKLTPLHHAVAYLKVKVGLRIGKLWSFW